MDEDISLSIQNGEAIGVDVHTISSEADIDKLFEGKLPDITANLIKAFTYDDSDARENARNKLEAYFARSPDNIVKLRRLLKRIHRLSKDSGQNETLLTRRIVILLTDSGPFAKAAVLAHASKIQDSIYFHFNILDAIERGNLKVVLEHEDRDIINGGHIDDIPDGEWQKLKTF